MNNYDCAYEDWWQKRDNTNRYETGQDKTDNKLQNNNNNDDKIRAGQVLAESLKD